MIFLRRCAQRKGKDAAEKPGLDMQLIDLKIDGRSTAASPSSQKTDTHQGASNDSYLPPWMRKAESGSDQVKSHEVSTPQTRTAARDTGAKINPRAVAKPKQASLAASHGSYNEETRHHKVSRTHFSRRHYHRSFASRSHRGDRRGPVFFPAPLPGFWF